MPWTVVWIFDVELDELADDVPLTLVEIDSLIKRAKSLFIFEFEELDPSLKARVAFLRY